MLTTISATITAVVCTPLLIASACISKIYSLITNNKPLDTSRDSFLHEMKDYVIATKGLTSAWVCNRKVHVLCRHATVFSNYPPIVIIHGTGTCSVNYSEFMQSVPKTHDVYCIDLPGWGVSEDPPFDLKTAEVGRCYAYYANIIMASLSDIYPAKNARFRFVGHSFGALLLTKAIALGYIPPYKIDNCVLTCMPGLYLYPLKTPSIGVLFISGLAESIFKQWWSRHLFSAFLYRKKAKTQLQTLQQMHPFIPNGLGHKLVSKHLKYKLFTPIECIGPGKQQVLDISTRNKIHLVYGVSDAIVNVQDMRNFADEGNKGVKCHELECGHSLFTNRELFRTLLTIILSGRQVE